MRIDMSALPEGLTHGPSRRFLTERGLPEAPAAALDFSAPGAERPTALAAFTEGDGGEAAGGEVAGGGRLFVLGGADYSDARVVLDGESGEVHLAEWVEGELRHDLLASGLPALDALIKETESVAEGAWEDADAYDGRRGPAVVAEVREAAEARLRAVDPRLFAAHSPDAPPHWGTALLLRALRWGARRGGPGGLAYEFGPDLVEELAGLADGGRVHRYRPGDLPASLTHEPTRRLLIELGLPLGGELFDAWEEPLRTMADVHPDLYAGPDASSRAYQRDHLAIGRWAWCDLTVALDGATGGLELPEGEGEPEAYLHQDLSALLHAWWLCERVRGEYYGRWDSGDSGDSGDWQVFDPCDLLADQGEALVAAVDPEAFSTPGHSWRMLNDDPYTGGMFA
ncbi:SUKH-4 family immunity protein [Streptomyces sp. NBC_01795]|uniref:SUKH-4 family immunity protein n=1 Tax=Streptomyces sp. NBC_01795 TaxID=2975943 RepID=UPI002DD910A3|nr:SUKH-4 family immunity protein [Streptomyces sp. NBC_01795]WSA94614.1 SUKH-4 family immunity protein [Streptomyces sp. NBC_01795]